MTSLSSTNYTSVTSTAIVSHPRLEGFVGAGYWDQIFKFQISCKWIFKTYAIKNKPYKIINKCFRIEVNKIRNSLLLIIWLHSIIHGLDIATVCFVTRWDYCVLMSFCTFPAQHSMTAPQLLHNDHALDCSCHRI